MENSIPVSSDVHAILQGRALESPPVQAKGKVQQWPEAPEPTGFLETLSEIGSEKHEAQGDTDAASNGWTISSASVAAQHSGEALRETFRTGADLVERQTPHSLLDEGKKLLDAPQDLQRRAGPDALVRVESASTGGAATDKVVQSLAAGLVKQSNGPAGAAVQGSSAPVQMVEPSDFPADRLLSKDAHTGHRLQSVPISVAAEAAGTGNPAQIPVQKTALAYQPLPVAPKQANLASDGLSPVSADSELPSSLHLSASSELRLTPQNVTLPLASPRSGTQTPPTSQIVQAIRLTPEGSVDVSLMPEDLGRVRLIMQSSEAGLQITVQSERQDTLDLLRKNVDQLRQEMGEAGFDDVSFSFGDQTGRESQETDEPEGGQVPAAGDDPHQPPETHVAGPVPVEPGHQLNLRL